MLSPLQVRKLTRYFHILDHDRNGYVEKADFDEIVGLLAAVRGWQAGTPEHGALHAGVMSIWEHLRTFGDSNGDGRATINEWLKYEEDVTASAENYARYATPVVDGLFALVDADGDGKIGVEEYRNFFIGYRIPAEEATIAFAKMDTDGDGVLSRAEIHDCVYDFHYSSDPDAPGNWLLGPY